MKRYLLSLLAMTVFVGCNKKDDNTTVVDISQQQQNYLPAKKVKRISCAYIEESVKSSTSYTQSDYLKPTLYNQEYTLSNIEYLYEYDAVGRINKITIKKENDPAIVKTFEYTPNSLIFTSPSNRTNSIDSYKVEFGFNMAGNILGFGTYDEKQQLKSMYRNNFTWENGNLTKISRKTTDDEDNEVERHTVLTYYNDENKNKFNLFSFELSYDESSFMNLFEMSIGMITGVTSKNLPKEVTAPSYSRYNSFGQKFSYTYTFEADGFVKSITEKQTMRSKGGTMSDDLYDNSYYGNKATAYWTELQTLITNIQNGTVTDKRYKLISEKDNEKVFQIIIPIKVEKDNNGNDINLQVDKVCNYTLRYKTENNQKKLDDLKVYVEFINNVVTNFQLNY
jgi:hypothetical protein